MLSGTLKSLHYDVVLTKNGRDALDWLYEHPETALVLLDYMMPDMNGSAILNEMDSRGITTPVVIISGMLPESMMREGHVLGRPILYKPFTLQDLSVKVHEALNAKPK